MNYRLGKIKSIDIGADRLAEWICDYAESNEYPSKMDVYLWLRKERNEDENFPINLRYR